MVGLGFGDIAKACGGFRRNGGELKVYKITKNGINGDCLIINDLRIYPDLTGGIDYEEVGDTYTIEIQEMHKIAFDNLPEWSGF